MCASPLPARVSLASPHPSTRSGAAAAREGLVPNAALLLLLLLQMARRFTCGQPQTDRRGANPGAAGVTRTNCIYCAARTHRLFLPPGEAVSLVLEGESGLGVLARRAT